MIAYTNGNTANLPTTTVPPAPKSWDKKGRAIAAAVKEMGPEARNGFEFDVVQVDDGRWIWRSTDPDKRPPLSAAQIKANGGKKAIGHAAKPATVLDPADQKAGEAVFAAAIAKTTADKIAVELTGTPAEKLALEIAERAADRLAKTTGEGAIPAFLKREPESVEKQDERIARMKKQAGPDRKIKNPPNVKAAKKKAGKGISKTAMVGQLLLRKEGCTTADILKATGWPSVSVPAQAKAVGLGLRKEKDGKVTRYFGVPKK